MYANFFQAAAEETWQDANIHRLRSGVDNDACRRLRIHHYVYMVLN
jgi:hypothetical protein